MVRTRSFTITLIICGLALIAGKAVADTTGVVRGITVTDPTGPWGEPSPSAVPKADRSNKRTRIPSLQAIFTRDDKSFAIMDDKEVAEGSWIAGYRIRRITTNYVYFTRNGKEYRLSLFSSKIKK